MADWKDVVVAADRPLLDVIEVVTRAGLQVALVTSADNRLVGVVTDGNIRRALLARRNLQMPVSEVMTLSPASVLVGTARSELLALMRQKQLHHLPLVDAEGRLVGLSTLDSLLGPELRPNWVVLMAGGKGKRLAPLTDDTPKPLLRVGGKPILENILESLAEQGFRRIFLSVNFKAQMIRDHFGSGERWGVEVDYLHEDEDLGTAGALSLLSSVPEAPILVMNGDLVTLANFGSLLRFHEEQAATATMAVREYEVQVPFGVVQLSGDRIASIVEKPVHKCFVNAGIYVLSPSALASIPGQSFFHMTSLFEALIAAGHLTAAYPLREYWLDIGHLAEFERAKREWAAREP